MILVTGGTGFIGSRVLETLLRSCDSIACIYRRGTDFSRVKKIYDQILWVDNSKESITDLFLNRDISIILHIATVYGKFTNEMFNVNCLTYALMID